MESYSVLMSVYHKEKPEHLTACIQSMMDQTVRPDDFVIVCDGVLTPELNSVLNNFQNIDMMLTDSNRFINGMHAVLESENAMLRVVFKDKMDELIARMEKRIQNYYPKEKEMLVSFLIGGSVHLMMKSKKQ